MKKALSFILSAIMIFSLFVPNISAAENDEFTAVVSIEGLTIGQGIYVKPRAYTLEEINSLVAQEGFGPFSEEEVTASMATLAFMVDNNLEYKNTGSWDKNFYLSGVKDIDKGEVNIPSVITENGGPSNENYKPQEDEYLGEFDYSQMSGWMVTVNNFKINVGASGWYLKNSSGGQDYGNTFVIRWQFSVWGFGADMGVSDEYGTGFFNAANKDRLYTAYAKSDNEAKKAAVLPVMENLTASQDEVDAALEILTAENEKPVISRDVTKILNESMADLASKVTEPAFGTFGGEWSVIALARGGFYPAGNKYFSDYYNRITETVNKKASECSLGNGALHSAKSTDNSRLILALSAVGKDPSAVGKWNLLAPFEDFGWIKGQGINGIVFALLALDSNNYETKDTSVRKQCTDFILENQLADGGWTLFGDKADTDITAMVLQSLAKYKSDSRILKASQKAFSCLSSIQKNDGTFASMDTKTSESCSQVIIACTQWGINPDTDKRFVKNGKSVLDALLSFYLADAKGFCHVSGAQADAMATDQGILALISYNRLLNGENSLYNMTDVRASDIPDIPSKDEMTASLSIPAQVENKSGTSFNAVISINGWDNNAGYKLIDYVISVPDGLEVSAVTAGSRLSGGEISYNLETSSGKLRAVYFDANRNRDIAISGTAFPAEVLTITFTIKKELSASVINTAVTGMSVKLSSDSADENSIIKVNTENAVGQTELVSGISFSAICLYKGDNVDLIPSSKKAVAVAVTGINPRTKLSYNDGTNNIEFTYSPEITEKTGVSTYVAVVDSAINTAEFADKNNYTISKGQLSDELMFGDTNSDSVVNAQDALNTVNAWLRKSDEPKNKEILSMNVNGDSRINTFDALGIVEAFVSSNSYGVVAKASELGSVSK